LDAAKSADQTYEIKIETGSKLIKIEDNGIGMGRDELIGLLGTIAKSGSKEFKEGSTDANSIIGQFGVGFYSAFMVSENVSVTTKKHDADSIGYKWTWDGSSHYEVSL
jgi:HSP90 family molecular chaperone